MLNEKKKNHTPGLNGKGGGDDKEKKTPAPSFFQKRPLSAVRSGKRGGERRLPPEKKEATP